MLRISAIALVTALTFSSGLVASESAKTSGETTTMEFDLVNVRVPDAMTVLRTMTGTKQLRPTGDRSVLVTETVETLQLAQRVVQMIDAPVPDETGFESFTLPAGDSVIAAIRLRNVDARDGMDALRTLRISRIAACCDGVMVIRDSPEQVDAARRLVQVLERVGRGSENSGSD